MFTLRRSLLVLGTGVLGLVFPAASMAVTYQIKTTPIHKGSQGFELTLKIDQGIPTGYGGRYPNSVQGILFKHNGSATENDNYTFLGGKGHPLKFTPGKKLLQFAQIKGTFAKGRGSINMFFHATGSIHRVKVPSGCTGHGGKSRSGTLSGSKPGSFFLHADKLGTIEQKSFKATMSTAAFQCTKPTHGYDVLTTGNNPIYVDAHKASANALVSEEFDDSPHGNGWAFDYKYTISGLPSSDYTIDTWPNLKSATVKGGGAMSGTSATYSSPHSSNNATSGTMSGSLAETFASIGKVNAFQKPRSASQSRS
jgi:hypothetical protein